MANTYLTPQIVTREALRRTLNNLVFAAYCDRSWSKEWKGKWEAKIGATANIRIPTKYMGTAGPALSIEDSIETSIPFTIGFLRGVHLDFDSTAFALDIDDFSERYLASACARIANLIDQDIAYMYRGVYNVVGTPGTVPTSADTYLGVNTLLYDNAAPPMEEVPMITNARMQQKIWPALAGLFHEDSAIGKQYTLGNLMTGKKALGFDWHIGQNTPVHTIGTYSGTPLVNGANQVGTSLVTDGWTAGAFLNQGDIIFLNLVDQVNPANYVDTTQQQGFVVAALSTADSGGNMTIPVLPSLTVTGPYQTVTNSPADNAPITVFGASGIKTPQGAAFHREAVGLVSIPQPEPNGCDMVATVTDEESGISIRIIRDYDVHTNSFVTRIEALYGVSLLRSEWWVRVAS